MAREKHVPGVEREALILLTKKQGDHPFRGKKGQGRGWIEVYLTVRRAGTPFENRWKCYEENW